MTNGRAAARVRSAVVEDAPLILKLIQQGFAPAYLPYTLFQAPESVVYLRELIAAGAAQSQHELYCLNQGDEIVGFYDAVCRDTAFFLNYISVSPGVQGTGLGQILLDHFEMTAVSLDKARAELDVFASNHRACEWYLAQRYAIQSCQWVMQVEIVDWKAASDTAIEIAEPVLHRGQIEEARRGFSKIECVSGSSSLTVGLIAGHTCKLLGFSGLSQMQAVASVCRQFRNQRQILIVPSAGKPPADWPLASVEKIWQMTKTLQDSDRLR